MHHAHGPHGIAERRSAEVPGSPWLIEVITSRPGVAGGVLNDSTWTVQPDPVKRMTSSASLGVRPAVRSIDHPGLS